jgi:hypothetical protein
MTDELLERIFVSQILILSKLLKLEKERKGVHSTSDFTKESIQLIEKNLDRFELKD